MEWWEQKAWLEKAQERRKRNRRQLTPEELSTTLGCEAAGGTEVRPRKDFLIDEEMLWSGGLMVGVDSLERFPRYKTVVTPRRAAVAIAGCWILSFVVGLTPMFGWNRLGEVERAWAANGSEGEPVIECEFEKVISMEYMVYFNFFVWVLPPLLLMVLIYLEVFYLIRKQLNKKVSASSGDPQKYYGKELKIAKSLALILFLFALSWLPLHILNCITLFCPSCRKPSVLIYIAIFLTHGNSAMNPIVYAFRIQKFRVTFLKIWNDHFRCQPSPPIDEDPPEEGPHD
ncbi:adenosine receptor A1 isoform X3 [Lutra lutra]|uniref:adenosine receptor A1 isoform X3 n=1 Tax=Lutra lutra TaxID=9657 RepID=UPI001FD0B92B|nr:adenosine receptor A1 isoform X3 [Lutra lutra]